MVMFKARFRPSSDKPGVGDQPRAARTSSNEKPQAGGKSSPAGRGWSGQQAQQPQPQPIPEPDPGDRRDDAPPIEKERGPQYPVKEPGPGNPPERV